MSTEERVINGRDLFVPEFNALLDTLTQNEKYRIVEFIFYYNIHAPRNKNAPEVMAIVLYFTGTSKERYEKYKKYGYDFKCKEFEEEYNTFNRARGYLDCVRNHLEGHPNKNPRTNYTSSTILSFTHGARFNLDQLRNDALTTAKPFQNGKHTEYIVSKKLLKYSRYLSMTYQAN